SPRASVVQRLPPPPRSTLFPYTTLFRSVGRRLAQRLGHPLPVDVGTAQVSAAANVGQFHPGMRAGRDVRRRLRMVGHLAHFSPIDRKSTRLNSSHVKISYAVFCLKKKKQ